MAEYRTSESTYLGSPIIEILVDGLPWGAISPYDAHFRFGLYKAAMLLAARDLVELFYLTDGASPPNNRENVVLMDGPDYRCSCTTYPSFQAHGQLHEIPYMKLVSGPMSLGFGVQKAEAFLAVEASVASFLNRHYPSEPPPVDDLPF